jgi:hypothetical protein
VGAVAAASAESTIENTGSSLRTKNVRINTNKAARSASERVMINVLSPFLLSEESLKNSPTLNAIKARAMSEIKSVPSMTVCGIRFKQKGPIIIPATIYAVTFGSLRSFVIRVKAKPAKSMIEIAIIT